MLYEYTKYQEAQKDVVELMNSINFFFNQEYQQDLSYHKESLYKMVLMRLVYEIVDIIPFNFDIPFDKYMYWMRFDRDEKEPLTEINLIDLKNEVYNLLTKIFYTYNIKINPKKIYKDIIKYMNINFNI